VDNVVTNLYAKFDDDRLRNEKALVLTTRTRTRFVALGDPFPGLKMNLGKTEVLRTFNRTKTLIPSSLYNLLMLYTNSQYTSSWCAVLVYELKICNRGLGLETESWFWSRSWNKSFGLGGRVKVLRSRGIGIRLGLKDKKGVLSRGNRAMPLQICKKKRYRMFRHLFVTFDTFSGSWHGCKDRIYR